MVRTPCARAMRLGCRVVEETCSKIRQHYMDNHWDRYERILGDPTYLAVLKEKTAEAARFAEGSLASQQNVAPERKESN